MLVDFWNCFAEIETQECSTHNLAKSEESCGKKLISRGFVVVCGQKSV
jgi:hypothetical protein